MKCSRHPWMAVASVLCALCLSEQGEMAEKARLPQAPRGVIQPRPEARPVTEDPGPERRATGPPSDRMLTVNLATSADSLRRPIRVVTSDGERPRVYIADTLYILSTRSTSTGDVFPLA